MILKVEGGNKIDWVSIYYVIQDIYDGFEKKFLSLVAIYDERKVEANTTTQKHGAIVKIPLLLQLCGFNFF